MLTKVSFATLICFASACSRSILIVPVDERGNLLPKAEVIIDDSTTHQGSTRLPIGKSDATEVLVQYPPLYLPHRIQIGQNSASELRVTLKKDQSLNDTVPSDDSELPANRWIPVSIRDSYALHNEWWRVLIATITSHEFQPALLDERSGYLSTQWKERTYQTASEGELHQVRRRIRGNLIGTTPFVYRIRLDIEHKLPGEKEFQPWERLYPEDIATISEFVALMERPDPFM
jgi:hypothetical protein